MMLSKLFRTHPLWALGYPIFCWGKWQYVGRYPSLSTHDTSSNKKNTSCDLTSQRNQRKLDGNSPKAAQHSIWFTGQPYLYYEALIIRELNIGITQVEEVNIIIYIYIIYKYMCVKKYMHILHTNPSLLPATPPLAWQPGYLAKSPPGSQPSIKGASWSLPPKIDAGKITGWSFQVPTPFEKYESNWIISPIFGGEHKKLWVATT